MLTAALLIGLCQVPTAHAAASFPRIDASGFQLVAGDTFTTYGARIAALEQKPALAPVGVTEVLAASNRTGRNLCHPTYLTASLNPQGFCWQDGDPHRPDPVTAHAAAGGREVLPVSRARTW